MRQNITFEHFTKATMPYYIYSVNPGMQLKKLHEFASFSEASVHAKQLRVQQPSKSLEKIKVMFAENELQAQDLLCQVRVAGPKGDD